MFVGTYLNRGNIVRGPYVNHSFTMRFIAAVKSIILCMSLERPLLLSQMEPGARQSWMRKWLNDRLRQGCVGEVFCSSWWSCLGSNASEGITGRFVVHSPNSQERSLSKEESSTRSALRRRVGSINIGVRLIPKCCN